jgi:hypothetical protein
MLHHPFNPLIPPLPQIAISLRDSQPQFIGFTGKCLPRLQPIGQGVQFLNPLAQFFRRFLDLAEKFGKFGQALQGRLQFLRCPHPFLLGKAFRFILRPLQVAGEFLGFFVQLSALVI